jgi:hypothetical protein
MWLRTSILAAIAVSLATGGYGLGASRSIRPEVKEVSGSSLGPEHPVTVALQQPGLKPAQRQKLLQVSDEAARQKQRSLLIAKKESEHLMQVAQAKSREIQVLQQRLDALQAELEKSAKKGGKVEVKKVQRQLAEARTIQQLATAASTSLDAVLVTKIDLRAAEQGIAMLDVDTRGEVFEMVAARRTLDANRGFALMVALDNRDLMQLTPQQVTALQLLQADFIRFFAPLREQYELISNGEQTFEVVLDWKGVKTEGKEPLKVEGKAVTVEFINITKDAKSVEEKVIPLTVEKKIKGELQWVASEAKAVKGNKLKLVQQDTKELSRLEAELKALQQKYNAKTYSQLKPAQQAQLRELMNAQNRN